MYWEIEKLKELDTYLDSHKFYEPTPDLEAFQGVRLLSDGNDLQKPFQTLSCRFSNIKVFWSLQKRRLLGDISRDLYSLGDFSVRKS